MTQLSHTTRIKIKCSLLRDDDRIRQDYSHVEELAESILERGLIQPIVITADYIVIDGGSRLRACRDVLKWDEIDVVFMETMPEGELRILEVEANIRRKDFSWLERVIAVVRIHELKSASAALAGERWGQRQTGELLGQSLGNVNNCVLLAGLIRAKDKEILGAATVSDALKLVLRRKENEATKLLAGGTIQAVSSGTSNPLDFLNRPMGRMPSADQDVEFFGSSTGTTGGAISITAPTFDELPGGAAGSVGGNAQVGPTAAVIPLSSMLLRGDCILHMEQMLEASVDHIITDIPYGIDMSNLQQENTGMDVSSVAAEHDVASNVSLMQKFLQSAYRVIKPQGFVVFFYDLDHHEKLQKWANEYGFRVQRWPLVWHKTHTCLNQAAGKNFTKNFEVAMVLSKGNASLVQAQGSSVWTGSNEDTKAVLQHPFVKPLSLWKWVYNAVAIRGQTVYDPFAGVGSSIIAAIDEGLKPLASELVDVHYNRLVVNISQLYRSRLGNVSFQ